MATLRKSDLRSNPRLTLSLDIEHPTGGQTIHPPLVDLFEILRDEEAYVAKHFGVMRDHYVAWKEFISHPRCMARTESGKPCQGAISQKNLPETPEKYQPNLGYYCSKHLGLD